MDLPLNPVGNLKELIFGWLPPGGYNFGKTYNSSFCSTFCGIFCVTFWKSKKSKLSLHCPGRKIFIQSQICFFKSGSIWILFHGPSGVRPVNWLAIRRVYRAAAARTQLPSFSYLYVRIHLLCDLRRGEEQREPHCLTEVKEHFSTAVATSTLPRFHGWATKGVGG